jgi:hypothetical protein
MTKSARELFTFVRSVNASNLRVVPQFELTPKALANFSPGFERSEYPGT